MNIKQTRLTFTQKGGPTTMTDNRNSGQPRTYKGRKSANLSPVPPRATPGLNDRPLRNAQYWRVVALLGDQMEESAAKWPGSLTARRHRDEFYAALNGVLLLSSESWQSELSRNTMEVKQEDDISERRWFRRNGLSATAQQDTPNPAA